MVLLGPPGAGWFGRSVVAGFCHQHCYRGISGSGSSRDRGTQAVSTTSLE